MKLGRLVVIFLILFVVGWAQTPAGAFVREAWHGVTVAGKQAVCSQ